MESNIYSKKDSLIEEKYTRKQSSLYVYNRIDKSILQIIIEKIKDNR